jgi:protein TonB
VTSVSEDVTAVPTETTFYLSKDGEVYGPHSVAEIQALLEAAVISPENFLWVEEQKEWLPIQQVLVPGRTESGVPAEEIATGQAFIPAEEALTRDEGEVPELPPWTGDPDAAVARIDPSRFSPRLSVATVLAILVHGVLLMALIWAAPTVFAAAIAVPPVTPPEPPPLEMTFIPEEAPPPPPPPSEPPPETQQPPADMTPPPPPAPADIPLPAPPQAPDSIPPPMIDTPPPLPLMAVVKPAPKRARPVQPPAEPTPSVPRVTDAGPSDYLYAPLPQYPNLAQRMRQQGTVILLVSINSAGDPEQVSISQTSGYAILDEAARKQVADTYRFKVGNAHLLRVPISFQLPN